MNLFTSWIATNQAYILPWKNYLVSSWGLSPAAAEKAAILFILLSLYNFAPKITSGYRSTEKQRELYNRWLAGDKTIHTPARPGTSLHEKRQAIDIACNNASQAAYIAHQIGLKTGLEYGDPVHFSL